MLLFVTAHFCVFVSLPNAQLNYKFLATTNTTNVDEKLWKLRLDYRNGQHNSQPKNQNLETHCNDGLDDSI